MNPLQHYNLGYQYDIDHILNEDATGGPSAANYELSYSKHNDDFNQDDFITSQNNADEDYQSLLEKKMREIDMKLERECNNVVDGADVNHIIEVSD